MAKQSKSLPGRTLQPPSGETSRLLRSAESLGRMIGRLQRQLERASRRLSLDAARPGHAGRASGNRHPARATAAKQKKVPLAADRESRRASKSARARRSTRHG